MVQHKKRRKNKKHNIILYTKIKKECNHRRYEINYKKEGFFFKVKIQISQTPS